MSNLMSWGNNKGSGFDNDGALNSSCENVVKSLQNNEINFMALDFDLTLISVSTNNWMVTAANWDALVNEATNKIRPVFKSLIPKLLKDGICVAIVSFSVHSGFIKAVLEKGFDRTDAIQIPIRDSHGMNHTWEYKGKGIPKGKQSYMASAAEEFHLSRKITISRKTTLLVDDDVENVHKCLSESVRAVRYDPLKCERIFLEDLLDLA